MSPWAARRPSKRVASKLVTARCGASQSPAHEMRSAASLGDTRFERLQDQLSWYGARLVHHPQEGSAGEEISDAGSKLPRSAIWDALPHAVWANPQEKAPWPEVGIGLVIE